HNLSGTFRLLRLMHFPLTGRPASCVSPSQRRVARSHSSKCTAAPSPRVAPAAQPGPGGRPAPLGPAANPGPAPPATRTTAAGRGGGGAPGARAVPRSAAGSPAGPAGVRPPRSAAPADPAGAVAVIWAFDCDRIVAGTEPNRTAVAPARCAPVIVTVSPPAV